MGNGQYAASQAISRRCAQPTDLDRALGGFIGSKRCTIMVDSIGLLEEIIEDEPTSQNILAFEKA